jgi:Icc-related predicted phosphoesterase
MKIMFLGDIHGSEHWLRACVKRAVLDHDCELIIQLGDFGYWEHTKEGAYYLDQIEGMCRKYKIPIIFIDGNHENHEMLVDYMDKPFEYKLEGCDFSELKQIREGLGWIPRGSIFTVDEITFMGFGGSHSVDKARRKMGYSWWPGEMISIYDVETAINKFDAHEGQIDIMLTHDTFDGAPMHKLLPPGINPNIIPECAACRWRVRDVVDHVQPRFLLHGHYHTRVRYEQELKNGHIVTALALACDSYMRNFDKHFSQMAFVLDTNELETENLRP